MTTTTAPTTIAHKKLPPGLALYRSRGGYRIIHARTGLPLNDGPFSVWRTQRDLVAAAEQLPITDWTADKPAIMAALGAVGAERVRQLMTPTPEQMPAAEAERARAAAAAERRTAAARHVLAEAEAEAAAAAEAYAAGNHKVDVGEANVNLDRARLAYDIATGAAPATTRFFRTYVSNTNGTTWERISWGRSEAKPGESADDHAARLAAEQGLTTDYLMSPKPWRIWVWTDPRPGRPACGEWNRHAVAAAGLQRYADQHGPIEIETPDGWQRLAYTRTCRWSRTLACVVTDTGEDAHLWDDDRAVNIRPAHQPAPADPRRIAPAAGQSRVIAGYLLHRYTGWQWRTNAGQWETITGARQLEHSGVWVIATAQSTEEYTEPDAHFAVIRPQAGPIERTSRTDLVGSGCACEVWPDSVHDPKTDTVYGRYQAANCPVHPPLAAGRVVTVAGGEPITAVFRALTGVRQDRDDVGRVVRTWINPADARRWYEIAMTETGAIVSRPADEVTAATDATWQPAATTGHPVIYEVQARDDTGGWEHEDASFASAGSLRPAALEHVAEVLAASYARGVHREVRVSVIPADEDYRHAYPDHIAYATAAPACDPVLIPA